jgi:hypothetical protein
MTDFNTIDCPATPSPVAMSNVSNRDEKFVAARWATGDVSLNHCTASVPENTDNFISTNLTIFNYGLFSIKWSPILTR